MPVIINDFEIVVEPPRQEAAQEESVAGPEAQNLTPEEIARVMHVHAERLERVRAD